MNTKVYHKTIIPGDPSVLCDALSHISGLSKSKVKQAMNRGAAWLQHQRGKKRRIKRATTKVQTGDKIWLYYDPIILSRVPPQAKCVKDCQDYSIWFKPAGLMSQGSPYGDHCTISRQVEDQFQLKRSVHLVHRLDREVAGLMVIAHNRTAASRLSTLFRNNQITKHYQAILKGDVRQHAVEGVIDTSLDNRKATTFYKVLRYDPTGDISTVDIQIQTGRRHQIRRHFDLIGYPVMGDPRYGQSNSFPAGLQLVAYTIRFECPFGRGRITAQIDPNLGYRS